MENKIIKATELGPEIILDTSGSIRISGKSRMEDASLYYKEAHDWLAGYLNEMKTFLTISIDLSYFNSSSAKQLLKLLMSLDEADSRGKVIWIYPENNDTLLERGRELEIMLDLPFEYKAK
jgi:hypothetical protein